MKKSDLKKIKDYYLGEKEYCTLEENGKLERMSMDGDPLPEDVLCKTWGKFYRIKSHDFSHEEILEYLSLIQTKHTQTIKNCVIFFTILTVINLVLSFVVGFLVGASG